MQWVPTVHELYCCLVYVVANVLVYTLGYHVILNDGNPHTARIRSSILIFSGFQSVLGFLAGMFAVKILNMAPTYEAVEPQETEEPAVWA